jgi:hypothetical protein
MENYAKTGGILSIVSGALGAGSGLLVIAFGIFFAVLFRAMPTSMYEGANAPPQGFFDIFAVFYGIIGLFTILMGVFAIVGGVYAIKKKYWGLALAGSIVASFVFQFTGIAAVVLTAMARNEFKHSAPEVSSNATQITAP